MAVAEWSPVPASDRTPPGAVAPVATGEVPAHPGGRRPVAPVVLARDRLVPVLDPLAPLLPDGGLRRGSTVAVTGAWGSTSLALALAARASAEGAWCAAVGVASLGGVAAAGLGVALERLALVVPPPNAWPTVVAALLDAMTVVLVSPPPQLRPGDARRLAARARERGSVLVAAGGAAWPAPDVRLTVVRAEWHGLGQGCGRLLGRRVEVAAGGRGSAARERRVALWLPHGDGGVVPAEPGRVGGRRREEQPA